jgi:hypothetical protein
LSWIISIPIVQATAIHPSNVTERRLTLKGVSPEFVEAVREYRAKRKARRSTRENLGFDVID